MDLLANVTSGLRADDPCNIVWEQVVEDAVISINQELLTPIRKV